MEKRYIVYYDAQAEGGEGSTRGFSTLSHAHRFAKGAGFATVLDTSLLNEKGEDLSENGDAIVSVWQNGARG